jgi:hypothetical protein
VKRFIGWVLLAARLHASLRTARSAISEVGRRPIRIRPARLVPVSGGMGAGNLRGLYNGGLSTEKGNL